MKSAFITTSQVLLNKEKDYVKNDAKEILKYLVREKSLDVNFIDNNNSYGYKGTVLSMLVAWSDNYASTFLINELNADPFINVKTPNNDELNILHLVVLKGRQGKYEKEYYLKTAQEEIDLYGESEVSCYLDPVNNCDYKDQRMLFEEILKRDDIKDNINKKTKQHGFSALHIAALRRDPYYINKLLENGADPTIKDNKNRTLYDLFQLSSEKRLSIIRDVVDNRTKFSDKYNNGHYYRIDREIFDVKSKDVLPKISKGFSPENSVKYGGHGLKNLCIIS